MLREPETPYRPQLVPPSFPSTDKARILLASIVQWKKEAVIHLPRASGGSTTQTSAGRSSSSCRALSRTWQSTGKVPVQARQAFEYCDGTSAEFVLKVSPICFRLGSRCWC